MNKLNCEIVKDLLPSYVEDLVSEETKLTVGAHLAECSECMEIYLRMNQDITIEPKPSQPNKKLLFYLNSVRVWYLICPLIALVLLTNNLTVLWHFYKGALLLMSFIFIQSQFFCGLSARGFDQEQIKYQLEAQKASRLKWGIFWVTPIHWCFPAFLVIFIGEIPRIIRFVQSFITYIQQ